ncbi:MAG: hypothetical protein L6Q57_02095 [Alphaproteobacteria bacterium]|nr:hypothetical protein [Alphaproteobacteria bacterium]
MASNLKPIAKPRPETTESVSAEHVHAAGLSFALEDVSHVLVDGSDMMVLFQDDAALVILGGADIAAYPNVIERPSNLDLDLLMALAQPMPVAVEGNAPMSADTLDTLLANIEPAAGDDAAPSTQNVDHTGFRFDDFTPTDAGAGANLLPIGALAGTTLDFDSVFEGSGALQDSLRDLSARLLLSGATNGGDGNTNGGGTGYPLIDGVTLSGSHGAHGPIGPQQNTSQNAGPAIGGIIGINHGNPGPPLPLGGPVLDNLPDPHNNNQHLV